jgi:signal transduction histidine kinase
MITVICVHDSGECAIGLECAIMGGMSKPELEPGFLQVFRIYVWLRLVTLLFLPLVSYRLRSVFQIDLTAPVVFSSVEGLVLLIYLYWPWFGRKLGRAYIPIGLVTATVTLIVEQYFFVPHRLLWQLAPFLYILLILVAWQYTYREVVGFVLCTAGLEIVLSLLFPQVDLIPLPSVPPEPGGTLITFSQLVALNLLISRSFSFLVLGYVVTRLVGAQRRQRQALAEANRKLVRHATVLEQLAVSRERLRLSRELHDTLAHTLSALAVQIEAVITVWEQIPDKARQLMEQMLATTRVGLDETRRALSALRASPLEELGLTLALHTLAEEFATRQGLALEFEAPESLDDLQPEVEQCYYRVAQEALENVARHAGASRVRLFMTQNSQELTMAIADDGRGFDPQVAIAEEKLGLQGMCERAELIGADLIVESRPDQGTTVSLRLEMGS